MFPVFRMFEEHAALSLPSKSFQNLFACNCLCSRVIGCHQNNPTQLHAELFLAVSKVNAANATCKSKNTKMVDPRKAT